MLRMRKRLIKIQKKSQTLLKKYRKQLVRYGIPLVLIVVAFAAGAVRQQYIIEHTQPDNLVWAVDSSVVVPDTLKKMLKERTDCLAYRGTDAPKGVGLWAITQVEKGAYAKLSYGCSWSLSSHAVAKKKGNSWHIIAPEKYFSDTTQGIPLCTAVIEHKIPPAIDGFCSNDTGKLTRNPNSDSQ